MHSETGLNVKNIHSGGSVSLLSVGFLYIQGHLKIPIAATKKEFVYKIKVNPIHTVLKYGDYHDFMDR